MLRKIFIHFESTISNNDMRINFRIFSSWYNVLPKYKTYVRHKVRRTKDIFLMKMFISCNYNNTYRLGQYTKY